MNVYALEVSAQCPVNDGERDLYQVTIRSMETIPVETILAFFAKYRDVKIYQEELTLKAATAIGAHVEITGIHSGVKVVSVAP